MSTKNFTVAANINYNGIDFNTKLYIEYKHTSKHFLKRKSKRSQVLTQTFDSEIAESWKEKGFYVEENDGFYFINRLAIPTINAKGENDIWYINNSGDNYRVNKLSKYAKKIHEQMCKYQKAN